MRIPLGIYPGTYLFNTCIYHKEERDGTHHFSDGTKLGCAGELCEGSTQGH